MSTLLVGVRSGKNCLSEVQEALLNFRETENLADNVRHFIAAHDRLNARIKKLKILLNHGIQFVDKYALLSNEKLKDHKTNIFVLHTAEDYEVNSSREYEKNLELLIKTAENYANSKFFLFDYDYDSNYNGTRTYGISYHVGLQEKTSDF